MKRSEVREHIFKIVFRTAFYPQEEWCEQKEIYLDQFMIESMEQWKEQHEITLDPAPYEDEVRRIEKDIKEIGKRAQMIMDQLEEMDRVIETISEGWKIGRIGKVELAILRVAIYEIQKDTEIPTGVAINEAVELAKKFGTEKSAKFVNGLLAKLA